MIYNDLPYAGEMNKKGIQTADSHVKTGGCKDFDRVIRWNSLVSSVSDWKNPQKDALSKRMADGYGALSQTLRRNKEFRRIGLPKKKSTNQNRKTGFHIP